MTDTKPTTRDYVIAVCKTFEISERELFRRSREHACVIPRLVMWVLMKDDGISVNQIGRRSQRDHTTVMHGLKVFRTLVNKPGILEKLQAAKALVPEIAHRRAQGEIIDLTLPILRPIEKTRLPVKRKPAAPIVEVKTPEAPKQPKVITPDEPHDVLRMRAHVMAADAKFAEALRAAGMT